MKRWLTLSGLLIWLFSPMLVLADNYIANPQDLSLDAALSEGEAYSMVIDDLDRPLVARSIAKPSAFEQGVSATSNNVYNNVEAEVQEGLKPAWIIDPRVGGVEHIDNTFPAIPAIIDPLTTLYDDIASAVPSEDTYLDIVSIPVYHTMEDVLPTYIFVGYRGLNEDGTTVNLGSMDEQSGHIGTFFEGGSDYMYVAVSNNSPDQPYNYATGEQSRNQDHDGFETSFDPTHYFGVAEDAVNSELVENYTAEDLPPGSSEVFLEENQTGINSLQVGAAAASGEDTSSGGGILATFLPFILMGAVLLIAVGSSQS